MLQTSHLNIEIGNFNTTIKVIVVEKMADNVFIIGRDILETFDCIIDYKNLSFNIGETSLPLLRAVASKQPSKSLNIHTSKTTIVPPYSLGSIPCYLKTKQGNNSSKRVFSTISGAGDINFKNPYLESTNALLNTSRGKTDILIVNTSEKPVYIYRNSKVGTLSTFHVTEINSLNYSTMHGRNSSHNSNITVPNRACRWKHNIDELYNALKLDELTHVSSAQMQHIKSLIAQYRNIFSENDLDLGCTDLLEQEIILDTNVPIRDKYYNIPLQLRPHAEKEIKRLLDLNIIEESTSNYHSPSFLMKKGNDYRNDS